MSTIKIEVDGKELEAQAGEMLIRVTDRNDIYIPRFCYHDKLSIAANCRMCLVEIERAPKPMPACATPVNAGMKVFTRSELARQAQKGTMEFLLINHPLDCPVCDQGGECPLQDQAMGYGNDDSRFMEVKRVVPNYDIGPLVATEMTRCIHCTRCVRFGEEVAGVVEMGMPGRGEHVKISTFLSRPVNSEVSGNIIDLCPVGALTSKPYRFAARSWELENHSAISPHDCLGTNINIQTLRGQVERVLPIENPEVNESWLADRDRFSYEAVNSEQRLIEPMIRENGSWRTTDWETALTFAAEGLRTIINAGSANNIGGIAGATSTLEEFYLLQKLLRGLGSENVDHRLQQCDFRDDDLSPAFPASEVAVSDYDKQKAILLIGSNIRKEQPLLSLKIRQGWKNGITRVSAINPVDYDLNFGLVESISCVGRALISRLAGLAMSIATIKSVDLPEEIRALAIENSGMQRSAQNLVDAGGNGLIILGALAQQNPDASVIKAIANWIADTADCKLAILAPANSVAGHIANCLPHGNGKNLHDMLTGGLQGFVLLGCEPELDSIDGKAAVSAMNKARFVVQMSAFQSESVKKYADVLLPVAAFTESVGTFINCEGRVQKAEIAANPAGQARPAWKVLRVLGNFMHCDGFEFITLDDVMAEIRSSIRIDDIQPNARSSQYRVSPLLSATDADGLLRITDMPMYRGDVTLRNTDALLRTADNPAPAASINPATAQRLDLDEGDEVVVQACEKNGSGQARLPLRLNHRMVDDCVHVPAGFHETANLGGHAMVNIMKVHKVAKPDV